MAESRAALGKYLGTDASNLVYAQNVTIALNIVERSLALVPMTKCSRPITNM